MDLELTDEERRLLAIDDRVLSRVGCWIAAIFCFTVVALLILGWQAYTWLKTGVWPLLPVAAVPDWIGLARPEISWMGLQRILDWLLACSISGLLFFCAMAAVFIFTHGDNKPEPEALRTARMKRACARTAIPEQS